jgi:hypothetical protein
LDQEFDHVIECSQISEVPMDLFGTTRIHMTLILETLRVFLLEPLRNMGGPFTQQLDQLMLFVFHAQYRAKRLPFPANH